MGGEFGKFDNYLALMLTAANDDEVWHWHRGREDGVDKWMDDVLFRFGTMD